MSPTLRQELLRKIPSVEEMLSRPEISETLKSYPRGIVRDAVRRCLGTVRKQLLEQGDFSNVDDTFFSFDRLLALFRKEMENQVKPHLRPAINATGVVIHTNLGRSPLHPSAIEHMAAVSRSYSNLEYDLDKGKRGSRYSHVEEILCRLSGAEASFVVNNNAAAVLLALNTLAEGGEVVVSRGELVEIGGSFRIPDVMRRSGARLKEVGTTNRTHLKDYEEAIGPQTSVLLKVHTSNFRVLGFTSEVSLDELVDLGRRYNLAVMNDLGSGCFVDLSRYGLEHEPTVQEAIHKGADIVTFSGDKLLGGPQAGIIVGKKRFVDPLRKNPLTRALRIDKLTLAALESTLRLYLDEEKAVEEIPTLKMLTIDYDRLRRRARRLLRKLGDLRGKAEVAIREDYSEVGGGALPLQRLRTVAVSLKPETISVNDLEVRLRGGDPPVIARISDDALLLDLRTVFDEEIDVLGQCIRRTFDTYESPF